MSANGQRIELMGLGIDAVREREVVETVVADPAGGWVCPVNTDVLRQVVESPDVRALVERSTLVVADGTPLVWASRVRGTPLPERVAGSSLILTVPPAAAQRGRSLFFLGGNPGSAAAAADLLTERHPGLSIAGTHCPPMGFERDETQLAEIERVLAESRPDIVFVGLGFPKQERLIARLRPLLPHAWFVSCGISFSFVVGEVRRAPLVVQRLGLEWVHRLLQEPRRLFRRYIVLGPRFLVRLMVAAVRDRR